MSRTQEVLLGITIIIGGIIVYPWVMDNFWDELVAPNLIATAPDNAWGDAFLAGAPIAVLVVIIGFGILLILGKMRGKDRRDYER